MPVEKVLAAELLGGRPAVIMFGVPRFARLKAFHEEQAARRGSPDPGPSPEAEPPVD